MTAEIAESFASSLSKLEANNRAHIGYLTLLAQDAIEYAPFIAQTILTHMQKARPEIKLPVLHLIDSIAREVGKAYIQQLASIIVPIFTKTYETVDGKSRTEMLLLRETWEKVFPAKALNSLDANLHLMDPSWSPVCLPTGNTAQPIKEDLVISTEHMKELDELCSCPVCHQRMDCDLRRAVCCVNGHAVCSTCKEKVPSCPTCKGLFSQEAQTLLRKLLDAVPRECPNTSCVRVLPQGKILEHLSWCNHRSVRCWMCDEGCEVNNIEEHYVSKHPEYFVLDTSFHFEIPVTADYKCMTLFKVPHLGPQSESTTSDQMFLVKIAFVESPEKMFTITFEWVPRECMFGRQDVTFKASATVLEEEEDEFKISVKTTASLDLQDNICRKVCLPIASDRNADVRLKISFLGKEKKDKKKRAHGCCSGSCKKRKS